MPEAIAIILTLACVGLLYVVARAQSAKHHPLKDREHLLKHHAWLEDRLRHAEKHNWDDGMKEHLATQLSESHKKLAASVPPSRKP